ncbi:MAG: alpha/beta hydrolase, partial [Acetobacteraceae bacterium]|nr:alpha/beta hydrolase [Acetobacteraceae bacterium]
MDLEAEYNNRARVPDHPAHLARWQREAAAFRAAHPPETLRYGAGEREAMDLFRPAGATDPPGALFLHGGYWQALGREWVSHCAAGLLGRGVAVGVASYDLCPAVPLAAICAQAEAAAAALAARLG